MKTFVALTAAVAMILVAQTLIAGEISQSSREALLRKQTAIASQTTSYVLASTPAMACADCKNVNVVTKRFVATKPWLGVEEASVSIHQCASCSDKMATHLKQTKLVHTCASCRTMLAERAAGA